MFTIKLPNTATQLLQPLTFNEEEQPCLRHQTRDSGSNPELSLSPRVTLKPDVGSCSSPMAGPCADTATPVLPGWEAGTGEHTAVKHTRAGMDRSTSILGHPRELAAKTVPHCQATGCL